MGCCAQVKESQTTMKNTRIKNNLEGQKSSSQITQEDLKSVKQEQKPEIQKQISVQEKKPEIQKQISVQEKKPEIQKQQKDKQTKMEQRMSLKNFIPQN